MKLLTLLTATFLSTAPAWSAIQAATEPPTPAWSVRLSLQDEKSPLHQELLKRFQPAMGLLGNMDFLKQLAWIGVVGLPETKQPGQGDFIVHLHFRDEGT